MIKVEIIDSSPIFAQGLTAILTASHFKVVACQVCAVESPPSWRADLLLVDPAAIHEVTLAEFVATTEATAPVLLLGNAGESAQLAEYATSGAVGFVNRDTPVDDLLTAVRTVANGGEFWTTPGTLRARDSRPAPDGTLLSPRERQVLRQIARGLTHGQVARRLGISPHTVDTYVKRIRSKLDLGNKAELTLAAVLGKYHVRTGHSGVDRSSADSVGLP